jgi:chromosome partitioning protein
MRSISVQNLKGGSGKTCTSLNLAIGLARELKTGKVLLVDIDASANASMTLLGGNAAEPTIGRVLLGEAEITQAIRPTRIKNLDLLPAAGNLATAAHELSKLEVGNDGRLRAALRDVEGEYEFAIIDGPPSMSIIALTALRAASEVLIPAECGIYSVAGIGRLSAMIEDVRRYCDQDDLHILRIVLTKTPPGRNGTVPFIEKELKRAFGALLSPVKIPYDITVERGLIRSRAVLEFDPESPAALAYLKLVKEVLTHGRQSKSNSRSPERPRAGNGRKKRRAAG